MTVLLCAAEPNSPPPIYPWAPYPWQGSSIFSVAHTRNPELAEPPSSPAASSSPPLLTWSSSPPCPDSSYANGTFLIRLTGPFFRAGHLCSLPASSLSSPSGLLHALPLLPICLPTWHLLTHHISIFLLLCTIKINELEMTQAASFPFLPRMPKAGPAQSQLWLVQQECSLSQDVGSWGSCGPRGPFLHKVLSPPQNLLQPCRHLQID